ncbi:hypothetical protein [Vibrio japonicus]|uniref:Uncharacterized protein n=1 Tax=Vibrio japonicus TaxID=1824638 RepID=A0ABY5LJU2_9VIBR|nr:hypothetical protein [Vibrio japonicus]UUM32327.1 hypothetical protein NP165_18770 [Vibrio japonicus]
MFEPLIDNNDELKLGISAPEPDFQALDYFVPLVELSDALIVERSFDILFVSGASEKQTQSIAESCEKVGTVVVFIENPSNDRQAIGDVINNLSGKLLSKEMPNNLDVADVRNIDRDSDVLFAFNRKQTALDFLESAGFGEVVSGIYLSHNGADLSEYESTSKQLLSHISDGGYLCSSFYSSGRSEVTILLGIRTGLSL